MNKMVGLAEFKANCLKLIAEMQKTGEPITLTKRGAPVAMVEPVRTREPKSLFGLMKSGKYRFDADPSVPVSDPSDWSALD